MRIFLGIKPNELSLPLLLGFQAAVKNELDPKGDFLRSIPSESLHLTLLFVGEMNLEMLNRLRDRVRCLPTPPSTSLKFQPICVLPSPKKPSVIGVKLLGNTPNWLLSWVERLQCESQNLGLNTEKREYLPHISLLRVRNGDLKTELLSKGSGALLPISLSVETFQVFQSRATKEGSRYEILEEFPLAPPL